MVLVEQFEVVDARAEELPRLFDVQGSAHVIFVGILQSGWLASRLGFEHRMVRRGLAARPEIKGTEIRMLRRVNVEHRN